MKPLRPAEICRTYAVGDPLARHYCSARRRTRDRHDKDDPAKRTTGALHATLLRIAVRDEAANAVNDSFLR